ncbi:VWA domain-containing protein [Deinococcus ruber]|uniref:Tellurium resistance protein n=1 Tax=Deinococcus ruber TaxID=1848197 RepID=A0A918FFN1_9DEIO|nr:VWA domain-containing protein [Deinococcus ruber]GGR34997.1 tellurium resistance protein [Deinococcus ruber]
MPDLISGQKLKLSDVTPQHQLTVHVEVRHPDADLSVFGLDADRQLKDDRYFVFFNQPQSPAGELRLSGDGQSRSFAVNLDALPASIERLMFVATSDSQPLSAMQGGAVTLSAGGSDLTRYPLSGAGLKGEKALMLLELYRHSGEWRLQAVGQGFDGGLKSLLEYFGGEASDDAGSAAPPPAAAPTQPAAAPVSLVKQRQEVLLKKAESTPGMVNLIKQAAVSLEKRGLSEARYRVKLVLDISASMTLEFRSGAVDELVRRALALAARLDDDGQVDVYLFGIQPHRAGQVSLDNVMGFVPGLRFQFEGGTHYAPIMKMLREDSRKEKSRDPVLILFITDGATSNRNAAEREIRDASREPLFWKFMGIEAGRVDFEFLEKLDDLPGRMVDNADFFKVQSPIRLSDAELFELLVNELDTWDADSRRAGLR